MSTIEDFIEKPAHIAAFHAAVKADKERDAALFAALFLEDGEFHLGSAPALRGPRAIEGGVAAFFGSLGAGIEHELRAAWETDDTLVWQADVTWTLGDGRRVTAPYVNVLRFAGDQVRDYRVHVDLSALTPPVVATAESGDETQPVFVIFDIDPARQQEIIDDIRRFHDDVVLRVPGFVSTSLHVSLDGSKLVNHGQWRSLSHYEAFLAEALDRKGPPIFREFPPDTRPYRLALQITAPAA
jgi:hypothetical protein